MKLVCCDLEGVFVPEVWINVSEKTGIPELRKTTRDEPDYGKLMRYRIRILEENGLKLKDIQDVIATLQPLEGAKEFLAWLRETYQVVIVSDTFIQFADPLMQKLDRPMLFCNELVIDNDGFISNFHLRQPDQKKRVAEALQSLNYFVIGVGDSYNDVSMLHQANLGILFRPPENVIRDFPNFQVTWNYGELKEIILNTTDKK